MLRAFRSPTLPGTLRRSYHTSSSFAPAYRAPLTAATTIATAAPTSYHRMPSTISAVSATGETGLSVFLVTSPNNETSRKLAESILTKKLAACVNLVPKITSLYWWDGKVQEDTEELLIIKSSDHLTGELEKEIKTLHPYDTPEFIRLPITAGSQEYLTWMQQSTKHSE